MLEVIGAGLPRTGTSSLQTALEILDYGPTMHMFSTMKPFTGASLSRKWIRALRKVRLGQHVDWDEEVTKGYKSGIDSPVSDVWRELAEEYPKAKIILTERDPESWLASVNATIMRTRTWQWGLATYWIPVCYWHRQLSIEREKFFQAKYGTHFYSLFMMEQRSKEVKETTPADRLLVYKVTDGWEPLCEFLGVPIPSVPFPRSNDTVALQRAILKVMLAGVVSWSCVLGGTVMLLIRMKDKLSTLM